MGKITIDTMTARPTFARARKSRCPKIGATINNALTRRRISKNMWNSSSQYDIAL
jgi:hypothetical protein